jgi:hypothetical protein
VISRNKRTVTLDFDKPEGQELLRQLAAEADVLVENFRPGVMERWGLGPDRLLEINPRLVMLRVTGFVRDNAFPVCLKPSDWRSRVEKKWPNEGPLANVSRTDVDLIESLQPYAGVDLSRDPDGAARSPLAAVTQGNNANNADKHAALHGAVACLAMTGSHRVVSIEPEMPVEILWTRESLTPLASEVTAGSSAGLERSGRRWCASRRRVLSSRIATSACNPRTASHCVCLRVRPSECRAPQPADGRRR